MTPVVMKLIEEAVQARGSDISLSLAQIMQFNTHYNLLGTVIEPIMPVCRLDLLISSQKQ